MRFNCEYLFSEIIPQIPPYRAWHWTVWRSHCHGSLSMDKRTWHSLGHAAFKVWESWTSMLKVCVHILMFCGSMPNWGERPRWQQQLYTNWEMRIKKTTVHIESDTKALIWISRIEIRKHFIIYLNFKIYLFFCYTCVLHSLNMALYQIVLTIHALIASHCTYIIPVGNCGYCQVTIIWIKLQHRAYPCIKVYNFEEWHFLVNDECDMTSILWFVYYNEKGLLRHLKRDTLHHLDPAQIAQQLILEPCRSSLQVPVQYPHCSRGKHNDHQNTWHCCRPPATCCTTTGHLPMKMTHEHPEPMTSASARFVENDFFKHWKQKMRTYLFFLPGGIIIQSIIIPEQFFFIWANICLCVCIQSMV